MWGLTSDDSTRSTFAEGLYLMKEDINALFTNVAQRGLTLWLDHGEKEIQLLLWLNWLVTSKLGCALIDIGATSYLVICEALLTLTQVVLLLDTAKFIYHELCLFQRIQKLVWLILKVKEGSIILLVADGYAYGYAYGVVRLVTITLYLKKNQSFAGNLLVIDDAEDVNRLTFTLYGFHFNINQ